MNVVRTRLNHASARDSELACRRVLIHGMEPVVLYLMASHPEHGTWSTEQLAEYT